MKKYCPECLKEVETKTIVKKEIYDVIDEAIEVEAKVMVCAECGEEFYNEELDKNTLLLAYNEYRKRHKLLSPEDIQKIRQQYGLSQRSFAKLLNWGDKTIFRYENGAIQDKAHNSLLLFLRKPENMLTYLTENEILLEERQKNKLLLTVNNLLQDKKDQADENFMNLFFTTMPCEENGYKGFDYDKLCAMVLFFAHKSDQLLKTKLMKLFYYSDMLFYKENGTSISGMKYVHLPYGPVPERFDLLLDKITADHIAHIEVFFDGAYEKHQIVAEANLQDGVLSKAELSLLNRVYEKFKNFTSVEISDYSHKEKGYCLTKQGNLISYAYASDMEWE